MSKLLLSLIDAELSYGNKNIFKNLSLYINEGDKICLVGRNGSGKSSILKILANAQQLDKGEIRKLTGLSIGYLPQENYFTYDKTIYEYVLSDIENPEEDKRYLADMILTHLGLDGKRSFTNLSGGKIRRVALAKALVGEPDILLLDEPTNHLDITAIEWLQNYILSKPNLAILCISHDREFLKQISNKVFYIDRGQFYMHNNGYGDFDNFLEELTKAEEERLRKLSKKLEAENHWLAYGVTARRKRNQRRLKDLIDLRVKLKNEKGRFKTAGESIILTSLAGDQASKLVLELENVTCGFNDTDPPKILFKNSSLRIMHGEKIGVIGRNGAGKTSFIKLLLGQLKPISGNVKIGPSVQISYADQKREDIDSDKTLWENLCPDGGDTILVSGKPKHVAGYLKQFLFQNDQLHSKASTLSGGEFNRLLLAKTLATPGNFIILDEPTNDLDMDSLEMLEEMLTEFNGTILVVSHDRAFLDELVTRTIILDGKTIEDFIGGYTDYLNEKHNEKSFKQIKKQFEKVDKLKEVPSLNKKNNKLSYKDQRDLENIPKQLTAIEDEINQLELELSDPELYSKSKDKFTSYTKKIEDLKENKNKLEERWLEVLELQEKLHE
ncbi:MAG: ABC-F family ATP-binding cassette domain-containing protein [Sphingobacteriia bacterium]|nr:ABC-F family ATP-binding cassette domain-containing protein [Sphingobacteriia bacterium]